MLDDVAMLYAMGTISLSSAGGILDFSGARASVGGRGAVEPRRKPWDRFDPRHERITVWPEIRPIAPPWSAHRALTRCWVRHDREGAGGCGRGHERCYDERFGRPSMDTPHLRNGELGRESRVVMQDRSYRSAEDKAEPVEDLLLREAQEHDRDYGTWAAKPFGLPTLNFTAEDVWRINDFSFRKGTYRRGYRKRRLFQLMELDQIAGKRVLDIGCGIGQHTVFHALHGAKSYGIDISAVGIATGARMARANNVADRCHFTVASVSYLPYEDDYFDIVVLNAALHHVIKYPNYNTEIRRVLKPGGKLFVADGVRNSIYKTLRESYRSIARDKPDRGDVDLFMSDLKEFLEGYQNLI